ncbi:hypothetical protein BKA83DRAFT_4125200 [Pisolithus microcarpus]|nr:hypothetical protein BKA83DRAFT_4125200 [Pisolithus microcarpus]
MALWLQCQEAMHYKSAYLAWRRPHAVIVESGFKKPDIPMLQESDPASSQDMARASKRYVHHATLLLMDVQWLKKLSCSGTLIRNLVMCFLTFNYFNIIWNLTKHRMQWVLKNAYHWDSYKCMEPNLALQGMKTHPVPSQPMYFHGKEVGIKAVVKQTLLQTPGVIKRMGYYVLPRGKLLPSNWAWTFVLPSCDQLAPSQPPTYCLVVQLSQLSCDA